MTIHERSAILRVLIDIIKADSVVDEGEITLFQKLKAKYALEKSEGVNNITLADALAVLCSRDFSEKERINFYNEIRQMTLADGSCCKAEALLLIALSYCFNSNAELISVNVPNLDVAEDQVLFVESKTNAAFNKIISDNYRQLVSEFRQAGLNFVYIPKVAEHYRSTNDSLFSQVCEFLAPDFDKEKLSALETYMKGITTARFCTEQLYGKLGMSTMYDTQPAFLVSIGSSFVNSRLYHNFLRIPFNDAASVVKELLAFVDTYVSLLSCDVLVVPKVEDANGQFLYSGYFKQLFDIYLLRNAERSVILIDADRKNIYLSDIDRKFDGPIHTKEKAFYALILFEKFSSSGVDFNKPSSATELVDYNHRIEIYQKRFNLLYKLLGGSVGMEPDLSVAETRQQMKSRINKYFKQSVDVLYQSADYMLQLDKKGKLSVNLDASFFQARSKDGNPCPFVSSTIFSQLLKIK